MVLCLSELCVFEMFAMMLSVFQSCCVVLLFFYSYICLSVLLCVFCGYFCYGFIYFPDLLCVFVIIAMVLSVFQSRHLICLHYHFNISLVSSPQKSVTTIELTKLFIRGYSLSFQKITNSM